MNIQPRNELLNLNPHLMTQLDSLHLEIHGYCQVFLGCLYLGITNLLLLGGGYPLKRRSHAYAVFVKGLPRQKKTFAKRAPQKHK